MFRGIFVRGVVLPAMLSLFGAVRAQEPGFREFTGKNGQTLVAKILRVSEDRRQMQIERQDGQRFETPITLFSLDDQQFVKDWMKVSAGAVGAPTAPTSDFHIEVSIAKALGDSSKHRDDLYTLEGREHLYRITVRNLSRDTLESARLEYALAWDDSVGVFFNADGQQWQFNALSDEGQANPVKRIGAADLEALRYNDSVTIDTAAVPIDRVLYDGNELYREDSLLGIRVRVRGADGSVLQEAQSGTASFGAMTWEQIGALADPRSFE